MKITFGLGKGILASAFVASAMAVGPAGASPTPAAPVRAPAVQSLLDCRSIADDSHRLACFDAAVRVLDHAEATGDLVTIDRKQRQAVRKQAFGLTLPSLAMFDRGMKPEELDRIAATVAEAHQSPTGRWLVRLDDGALWRQIDDTELNRMPRAGAKATIRRAMLGSFFMDIQGESQMRVHRDN